MGASERYFFISPIELPVLQWIEHPITEKYSYKVNSNGSKDLGHAYRAMKTTGLKEIADPQLFEKLEQRVI